MPGSWIRWDGRTLGAGVRHISKFQRLHKGKPYRSPQPSLKEHYDETERGLLNREFHHAPMLLPLSKRPK